MRPDSRRSAKRRSGSRVPRRVYSSAGRRRRARLEALMLMALASIGALFLVLALIRVGANLPQPIAREIEGLGTFVGPGESTPVPIASVAKVMTAYLARRCCCPRPTTPPPCSRFTWPEASRPSPRR